MRIHYSPLLLVLLCPGCDADSKLPPAPAVSADASLKATDLNSNPAAVTNRFGMRFLLVAVDPSRADHQSSFPSQSYYLQETELQGDQHMAFRRAAQQNGIDLGIDWDFNSGFPGEWSDCVKYAEALSQMDPDYDYLLPSMAEWTFACSGGYEQQCDHTAPNHLGFQGLISGPTDAEAARNIVVHNGYEFGVVMGYWKNNWGGHTGREKPDCPCEFWTHSSMQADDSLNELVTARLVIVPEGSALGESVEEKQP